jgi:hypothetical protein
MTATATGVPTGTAAGSLPNPAPAGTADPCSQFTGAGFEMCTAFCTLGCDTNPRFPCGVIDRLFRHFTGDMTPPSCQTGTARTITACSDLSGRAAQLCTKVCARCNTSMFASSCMRLERQYDRITGGAPLPC